MQSKKLITFFAAAVGLLSGVVFDRLVGDPRRGHPVALFGSVAARLESRVWRDSRPAGLGYAGLLVGGSAGLGLLLGRLSGVQLALATAAGTWTVLGGCSLVAEARAVEKTWAAALEDAIDRLTFVFKGRSVVAGASAGAALVDATQEAAAVMEAADRAMYMRKAQRRHETKAAAS